MNRVLKPNRASLCDVETPIRKFANPPSETIADVHNGDMSRRQKRIEAKMDEYGRPKRPGKGEPNDRHYDRAFEEFVNRMDPGDLNALLHDGDEEPA
jgi:hypothetical protein